MPSATKPRTPSPKTFKKAPKTHKPLPNSQSTKRPPNPKTPSKPTGIGKSRSTSPSPPRHTYSLRHPSKYFWYTSVANTLELATTKPSASTPTPTYTYTYQPNLLQINDYTISPLSFTHTPYPSTFPPSLPWPPTRPSHIARAIGRHHASCVGESCYTRKRCRDMQCGHAFSAWRDSTALWEDYFELRETRDRGVGAFTKRAFRRGAVLGWYAGTIVACDGGEGEGAGKGGEGEGEGEGGLNDYVMELGVGDLGGYYVEDSHSPSCSSSSSSSSDADDQQDDGEHPMVLIDGLHTGNWTRFINHSCDAHADFEVMRVGTTRIMAVVLRRDVGEGVELTVSYGEPYWWFRRDGARCCCGSGRCVSLKMAGRGRGEGGGQGKGKGRKEVVEESGEGRVSVSRKVGR
ncbi:SET domain-containing protein [Byssothecium circinans]|uniref:SET domain-containing protein n=1 Tax=Byssothecium circinans TaxID=147558 RepID=A0A6A5TYF4_9PLEO|nr:SET domain-containing protein [Byssothecium circinans]